MARTPTATVDLDLPYPPADYWVSVGASIALGPEAARYRERVAAIAAEYTGPALDEMLCGHITFSPPNDRCMPSQMALDHAHMAVMDALDKCGLIDELRFGEVQFLRGPACSEGKVRVLVESFPWRNRRQP